jgi:hemolysin activation/secretion protein
VLPAQRGFYLGGPQTVHAHRVASASGNAFWFARAELTRGTPIIRPTLFADLGWAGDRAMFTQSSAEIAAVGIGAAALDGLVRFDISRAVRGGNRWGFDLFIDLR